MSTQPARATSLPEPPGPEGLPWFGSLFEARRDPLELFMRTRRDFGQIAQFQFGPTRYVIVSNVDAVKHVLVDNHRNYRKSLNYDGLKFLLGQGLLTSEGDFWLKQRRLAQPAFHRERLQEFGATMIACTDDMLRRWEQIAAAGVSVDVHEEMMALTLKIVVRTLFGADVKNADALGDAVSTAIYWANDYIQSVIRIPPNVPTRANRKFKKAKSLLDALVQSLIDERRSETTDRRDLLATYMAVRDEDTGEKMSDQQIRDEVMTLVLAGHETTANALAWTFYLLSLHPEDVTRVHDELAHVLNGRAPAPSDLKSLPEVTYCIEESMRLYPPAWVMERQANEDDVLCGHRILKDTIVGVSPYLVHREPAYWPNPEGFDPHRFLPENSVNRPKLAYIPFGAGPRMCIGQAFAQMEAQLIVARVMQRFTVSLRPGHVPVRDPSVTLRTANGMPMMLKAR